MTATPANRRRLRLPSFGVALAVSLAVLLAFAVWMFVDALFPVTMLVVRTDLGLLENPGLNMAGMHTWDELRPVGHNGYPCVKTTSDPT
jgi:hypothetical protein